MKKYYFCDTHMSLAKVCEVVTVNKMDNVRIIAEKWGREHNIKNVYIYNMERDFIWSHKVPSTRKTRYGEEIELLNEAVRLCNEGGCYDAIPIINRRIQWMNDNNYYIDEWV